MRILNEICPCCGIQYGYDDEAGGDINKRKLIYKERRIHWIMKGMPWKSIGMNPPINRVTINQLKNI